MGKYSTSRAEVISTEDRSLEVGHSSPSRRIRMAVIVTIFFANVLVCALTGFSLYRSRQQFEYLAEVQTQNVATALDQNLSSSLEKIDLALRGLADELEHELTEKHVDERLVTALMTKLEQRLPEVEAFRVSDANGLVIFGKGVKKQESVSWADREYFIYFQDNPTGQLQVSRPRQGRVAKKHIVGLSRRYNNPNGSFAGVISASIPLEHFAKLLSGFKLGENGTLILRDSNFGLITRIPAIPNQPAGQVGNSGVSNEFRSLVASGARAATYHIDNSPDGYERTLTFRRLDSIPMIAIVGVASKDYLVKWHEEAIRDITMVAGVLVLSLLLGGFLLRMLSETEEHAFAISESRKTLESVIESTQDGIAVCHAVAESPYIHFTVWNDAIERLTGYTLEDINRLGWYQTLYIDPEVQERARQRMDQMRQGNHLKSEEWVITRKDGIRRTVQISTLTLPNETTDAHVLATIRDVTDAQQREETLRNLFSAIEQSPASVVITDLNACVEYVNPKFTEVTGYTAAEVIGQNPRILQSGQTPKEVYSELWNRLSNGLSWHGELTNRRKSGEVYWEDINIAPVRNSDGVIFSYVAVKTDISQRKFDEKAKRAASLYARSLIEASLDPLVTVSVDGKITDVNAATENVTGVTRAKLIGTDFSEYFTNSENARQGYRLAFAQGKVVDYPLSIRHTSGKITEVVYNASVYRDEGGVVVGLFAAARDITERKRVEAELEKYRSHLEELVLARTTELAQARDVAEAANRAKGTFLANMSHELRTPMNGIMGMTEIMLRKATDTQQINWLRKSKASAEHLLAVINNILDISKIESNQLTLEEQDFSVSQVISSVLEMQDVAARTKGLNFSTSIAGNVPDNVKGDALRLKQIILNFVGNAVKFTDQGTIELCANLVEEDSHSSLVRFDVKDQGIGVNTEQLSRLFQAFVQGDNSDTRKYGGTGLGLVIAQRIARLMGGDPGVASEYGKGSTFWAIVRLRRSITGQQSTCKSADIHARDELIRDFSGSRVLLVEDEPVNREVITLLLEDAGLSIDAAVDGQDAVSKARAHEYELILMDVQMPIMNGLDATQAIRQFHNMGSIPSRP